MNSICGLNVVKVSCCGLCALLERLKVGDADSHEHNIALTLPHVFGPHQELLETSSEDLEVLCSVVITTFVATLQLFSFFKSREKAIRITGGHWLAQRHFFAVYMQETVIETGKGL